MKEINLNVKGMVCNGCENRVKNALENIKGVKNVNADHKTDKVKILLENEISENLIREKIENLGFEIVKAE